MPLHSFRRHSCLVDGSRSHRHIDEHQLRHALGGVTYPAQRWELMSWAYYNGSGDTVMPTVSDLPEREYENFEDVCREILQ